jgi:hypothetical protein
MLNVYVNQRSYTTDKFIRCQIKGTHDSNDEWLVQAIGKGGGRAHSLFTIKIFVGQDLDLGPVQSELQFCRLMQYRLLGTLRYRFCMTQDHIKVTRTLVEYDVYFVININGSTAIFRPFSLFSSLIIYTIGRIPWTGDQPVAKPLPIHKSTKAENKHIQTSMLRVGFEPTSQVFFWVKTFHALEHAAIVIGRHHFAHVYVYISMYVYVCIYTYMHTYIERGRVSRNTRHNYRIEFLICRY